MFRLLINFSKIDRLYVKKLLIPISLLAPGYLFYKKFENSSNVYLRFLRTFYIGILNSLDYKWNLYGLDDVSEIYKKTITVCHQRSAERILQGCLANGGLYIKLGQGLVALNHILPPQYIETLESLHDKATPKSFDKVREVFLEDLGQEPREIFKEFVEIPFAAASIAQVHEAISKSNQRLAVKVQYHDLQERFNSDISTLEILLRLVETIHPTFGFSWVLKDMKETLLQEMDFVNEAENSKRCQRDLNRFQHIHVPQIYDDLCSKRILTTEFIDGVKINEVDKLRGLKVDFKWLDKLMVQVFSHQLFHTGFVHADPHPGNLLVRVKGLKHPQLVILDHGLYETMVAKNHRLILCSLTKSLITGNFKDTETYSKKLGVEDWETFGEIILQRPLNLGEINKKINIFQSKLSDEDIEFMKKKSSDHFDKIMIVLRKMPKPMLLFIRNLNTIRSICRLHGEPINRYYYMTDSAIRALHEDRNVNYFYNICALQLELAIFKWKTKLSDFRDLMNRFILNLLNYFGYGLTILEIEHIFTADSEMAAAVANH